MKAFSNTVTELLKMYYVVGKYFTIADTPKFRINEALVKPTVNIVRTSGVNVTIILAQHSHYSERERIIF